MLDKLTLCSFSIGIGDTIPDENTIRLIEDAINKRKDEVTELTRLATENELEPLPGMNVRETFESKVSKALNTARDDAGTVTEKSLKDVNNAVQMAVSGSKGSKVSDPSKKITTAEALRQISWYCKMIPRTQLDEEVISAYPRHSNLCTESFCSTTKSTPQPRASSSQRFIDP